MINYFLNEAGGMTSQKRKIIYKKFLHRRKYNPFHLDCQYTNEKLCYCKKNPITYLSENQKAALWTSSYMKPYEYFCQVKDKAEEEESKQRKHKDNEENNLKEGKGK